MTVYLIEHKRFDWVDDYECECNYYLEDRELYTSKETAEKRIKDLEYEYSHEYDDDEDKIVEMDDYRREQNEMLYIFTLIEVDLQDITPDQLPKIKVC